LWPFRIKIDSDQVREQVMRALESAMEGAQVLLKIVRKAHIQPGVQTSDTTVLRAAEVVQKDILVSLLDRYNLWRIGGFMGMACTGLLGDRIYSRDNILRGHFPWRLETSGEEDVTVKDFGYCPGCFLCCLLGLLLSEVRVGVKAIFVWGEGEVEAGQGAACVHQR